MNYLEWLSKDTQTKWWHDSAIPAEIDDAVKNGALGVTTNPVLTYKAFQADPAYWEDRVKQIPQSAQGTERVEALLKIVALEAAGKFKDVFEKTDGMHGYALAQVNPAMAGDTEYLMGQAFRYASWADNIAVKLPTVKASLPVIEALAEKGIAVCTTLNFSVSQAMAACEAYERGINKAKANGTKVRPCFIVQQGGRLDDYLVDVVQDNGIKNVSKEDILNAGNAVCKRSYQMVKAKNIPAYIMPAGLRGVHHLSEMAGGDMVFSLQARMQKLALEADLPQVERIDEKIDQAIIDRLMTIDEFKRAYEPGGIKEDDFVKFGVTQRTLSQFLWTGWAPLETYGSTAVSDRWF